MRDASPASGIVSLLVGLEVGVPPVHIHALAVGDHIGGVPAHRAEVAQDDVCLLYTSVALLEQGLDDAGQRLRGVEGGVVEEDDGAGLHPGRHPLRDLPGGELFPVQTIPIPNSFKPLGRAGCRL